MAMVMDRLFLWIFTVAVLVGTAGIILQVGAGRGSEGNRHGKQPQIIFLGSFRIFSNKVAKHFCLNFFF